MQRAFLVCEITAHFVVTFRDRRQGNESIVFFYASDLEKVGLPVKI
jgi:hypothetical protein